MDPVNQEPPQSVTNIAGISLAPFFPIGRPVQLEFKEKKYSSFFRGVKAPEYVLADIPMVNGRHITIDYNSTFTVRFIVSGVAYGFTAFLQRVHTRQALLVLEYPENVKKLPLRASDRVEMFIPVKIIIKDHKGVMEGAILDLSNQGALIAVPAGDAIASGQRLKISMILPNGKEVKSIFGVINNIKASGGKMRLGINFHEKEDASLSTVRQFYMACLSYLPDQKNETLNDEARMFSLDQDLTLEWGRKKAITTLRGWKCGERGYILIDPPPVEQMSAPLRTESRVVIRTVRCGNLLGLEGRFIGILEKSRLWAFALEGDILKFPLRSDERSYCMIPALLLRESNGKFMEAGKGMIFNLSLGGAKLITKTLLVDEKYLWLRFSLGLLGKVDAVKIRVIRSIQADNKFEYACSFVSIARGDNEKLMRFFENSRIDL